MLFVPLLSLGIMGRLFCNMYKNCLRFFVVVNITVILCFRGTRLLLRVDFHSCSLPPLHTRHTQALLVFHPGGGLPSCKLRWLHSCCPMDDGRFYCVSGVFSSPLGWVFFIYSFSRLFSPFFFQTTCIYLYSIMPVSLTQLWGRFRFLHCASFPEAVSHDEIASGLGC